MQLTEENFLLYTIKHYNNPSALSFRDYEDDIKIITYIKKQLSRDNYNHHLVLNHIITLFNVFDNAALHMLFFKIDRKYWNDIITYLVFINRMPDKIPEYDINITDYPLNQKLVTKLREL